jgi:hypothetical protein
MRTKPKKAGQSNRRLARAGNRRRRARNGIKPVAKKKKAAPTAAHIEGVRFERRFAAVRSQYGRGLEHRLRALHAMYCNPNRPGRSLRVREIDELKAYGIVPEITVTLANGQVITAYSDSLAKLAKFLTNRYSYWLKREFKRESLFQWQRGLSLEYNSDRPNFPRKGSCGFDVRACIEWVDRWIVPGNKFTRGGNGWGPVGNYY